MDMFDRETGASTTSYGASVKRVGFRGRLFLILLAFALVPSILMMWWWKDPAPTMSEAIHEARR